MSAAASQVWSARTGQVSSIAPWGMPTFCPCPSWSVLLLLYREGDPLIREGDILAHERGQFAAAERPPRTR